MKNYLRAMRISNYYKNLIIFSPIPFSLDIIDPLKIIDMSVGFLLFSLTASGIYIMNDIRDIPKDRLHPKKKKRVIASGKINTKKASIFALFLLLISLFGSFLLNSFFFIVLIAYIVNNIIYTLFWKKTPILDILSISFGFLLRAITGLILGNLPLSEWFILTIFFIALFLALSKRKSEYLKNYEKNTREVLEEYSNELLDNLLSVSQSLIIISYSLYTFQSSLNSELILTIPFVIFLIFRFTYLTEKIGIGEEPQEIFKDIPSIIGSFIYFILFSFFRYSNSNIL